VRRRTIGLSLLVIGMVFAMLGFGSWAVFNDTESGSATVGAGTLDLELDAGAVVPGTVGDLKPSEWHYLGPFLLENVGDNPGVLDLHFMNIVDSGGDSTEPEEEAEYPGPIDDISNWIDVDWCVDDDTNGECNCTGAVVGKLGDIESMVIDLDTTLVADQEVELWLSFHLEREAGNEYQGDYTEFDIEFTMHQPSQPAGATTVRLENKVHSGEWPPILDDDIYGSVTYWVNANGDLRLLLEARGLDDSTWYQIGMTGPGGCTDTDDQLASGVQQYPDFDSHFWEGGSPSGTCTSDGYGFYHFDYQQPVGGVISQTYTINNTGLSDPDQSTDVAGTYPPPALPSGIYSNVKFLVKDYDPNDMPPTWPATFTSVLMEMVETLNFNLP
jgi:predicted ribosomally synthesized peptide with SipW-like signal peptide